jgi:hypothetical protein
LFVATFKFIVMKNRVLIFINRVYFLFVFSFLIFAFHISSYAQTPTLLWEYTYGGADKEYATHIEQTHDSGFITIGRSHSTDGDVTGNHGSQDIWVIKLSKTGVLQWEKSLGGTAIEQGSWITQTMDGGYILTGWTISHDGDITHYFANEDYWVVKLDDTGGIMWQNNYGGTSTDMGKCILETVDTDYLVAGYVYSFDSQVVGGHGYSDMWIAKLDKTGGIIWKKGYGGSGHDGATVILQVQGGGYIVAGGTDSHDQDVSFSHGGSDYWVVRLDDTGKILWEKAFGGSDDDFLTSFVHTFDGGYIMSGYTNSNNGDVSGNIGGQDYWTIKIDDTGDIMWQKCYGGSTSDQCYSIQQTSDSGYIMAGSSYSVDGEVTMNYGNMDFWVVKTDKMGMLLWQKNLGGTGIDNAYSVIQTFDKNFVVMGWTGSIDHDVSVSHGEADFWVAKLQDVPTVDVHDTYANDIQIYPVPSNGVITVILPQGCNNSQLKLFDLIGREIAIPATVGLNRTLSLRDLSSGTYFLQVITANTVSTFTMPIYQGRQ